MAHQPTGIERRHRFGAQPFAAIGMHGTHRHAGVHLRDHRLDQIAALVDLGDDGVSLVGVKGRHGAPRPGQRRRRLERTILQHHRALAHPRRHDNATGIGPRRAGHRRVHRHDHPPRLAAGKGPEHAPLPQCARVVIDQLAVQLLPAQHGAAIALDDALQKSARQKAVLVSALPRHGGLQIVQQPPDQPGRPRRGRRHLARPLAQAQAELQHVPGRFRLRPFADFVRPRGRELRSAKALRIAGRKHAGRHAIGPGQRLVAQHRHLCLGMDAEQAARPAHHHGQRFGHGLAHQRDGRDALHGQAAHPFGAGPCLSSPAATDHQPGGPVACGRQLRRLGPGQPVEIELVEVARVEGHRQGDVGVLNSAA